MYNGYFYVQLNLYLKNCVIAAVDFIFKKIPDYKFDKVSI